MYLVDTSIWIELLNGRLGDSIGGVDLERFLTCGPVIQEVLQGIRDPRAQAAFGAAFAAVPALADPIPRAIFEEAAEIYRQGRQRGFTIRSSNDCLIAAIAIREKVPVWHRDRDFALISRYTPLQEFQKFAAAR